MNSALVDGTWLPDILHGAWAWPLACRMPFPRSQHWLHWIVMATSLLRVPTRSPGDRDSVLLVCILDAQDSVNSVASEERMNPWTCFYQWYVPGLITPLKTWFPNLTGTSVFLFCFVFKR